ncbi:MAG: BBP7 family outer membrane beta-barrel protein, partial [Planctomycetota bacterium]
HVGRYFGCGLYGIDVGLLFWEPSGVWRDSVDGGAGLRFTHPALNGVSINRGGGPTSIYDEYDTNAVQIRSRRDVAIHGVEVNLVSFGLMGARRLGRCAPTPILGRHPHAYGYFGGALGPLARACSGRVRIQSSHGFRWFRFEDSLEIIGDVDGTTGYSGSDLYYLTDVENNLYGYQFGSVLTYCLGCRFFLNVGGKFGVYGNDVHHRHTITTQTNVAYTNSQGGGAGDLCCEDDDLALAGLGELDLGFGYRFGNRLTFTGGYRVLGVSGISTAFGQMPNEYTTNVSATRIHANDSILLHGAYVGFDYNW